MVSKLDFYTAAYKDLLPKLTDSPNEWQDFLFSASKNYKLRFDEQVLVYGQKPKATAVLELERWNSEYNRWVNRGAHGIATFSYDVPGRTRLKYYFDISDTHEGRNARPVVLWEMQARYEADVLETLGNTYEKIEYADSITKAITMAAGFATEDNIGSYADDLIENISGSSLESTPNAVVRDRLFHLVNASVAYTILARCGYDAKSLINPKSFEGIELFNTEETVGILGNATSDIAEHTLREIATTVRVCMRDEKNEIRTFAEPETVADNASKEETITEPERSESDDRDEFELQRDSGRLPDSGRESSGGTGSEPRTLGEDETEIPESGEEVDVQQASDELQADGAPRGDREHSGRENPADDREEREVSGSGRRPERTRPPAVGRTDDKHQSDSGADGYQGADTELDEEEPPSGKLDWHDMQDKAEGESLPLFNSERIDSILLEAADIRKHHSEIAKFFAKDGNTYNRIDFVKNTFTNTFTGVYLKDESTLTGYRAYMNVLHLWTGNYLTRDSEIYLSWEDVVSHIGELIERGEIQRSLPVPDISMRQLSLFDSLSADNGEIEPSQSSDGTVIDDVTKDVIPEPELPIKPETSKLNYRITDDALGHGGAKTKFQFNIAAIKLLHTLESEDNVRRVVSKNLKSRIKTKENVDRANATGQSFKTSQGKAESVIRSRGRNTTSVKPDAAIKSRKTSVQISIKAKDVVTKSRNQAIARKSAKSIKTYQAQMAKRAVKQQKQAAHKIKAAQKAAQNAKRAAKAAARAVRALISAMKSLVAAMIAGGWVTVIILIVVVLIAAIAASPLGVFFSNDNGTGMTMREVVEQLNGEFSAEVQKIEDSNAHDELEINSDGEYIDWKEVISIYACSSSRIASRIASTPSLLIAASPVRV